jgi:aryl-alcohol dehydrogenase-like predicted oxidoreductase
VLFLALVAVACCLPTQWEVRRLRVLALQEEQNRVVNCPLPSTTACDYTLGVPLAGGAMHRRDFLKTTSAAAFMSSAYVPNASIPTSKQDPIAKRRLGKTGVELSIIALGGVAVMNDAQDTANNLVAEAFDRGINYFDVAPSYGDAQDRLGPALEPYRSRSFLACKTQERTRDGSRKELEGSLKALRSDHVDLYQFHALTKMSELDQVLGPNGAMETFEAARKEGKIRFIGFSAHSVETALAAMDRYNFDTILFPINFVLFSQANFGPQVLEKAQQNGMGILALKAMARSTWSEEEKKNHPHPKCWYHPAGFPDEAALGLRWTLSHPVTAAVPPGDESYFRLAMDVAQQFKPISKDEEHTLIAGASGAEPLFHLHNS